MHRARWLPILLASVMLASPFFGQQTDDSQPTQPGDNVDVVTQIQQLRADVERLTQQLDRLNNEVKSLQANQATVSKATRPAANPAPAPPAPAVTPAASATDETNPITTLIFRDGRRLETRNYAIVGESIWVYTEQDSKKYRVADLNIDATKKANADQGVLFQLPPNR
jgi:TolA-binding protein